jgi:hypothetical protein
MATRTVSRPHKSKIDSRNMVATAAEATTTETIRRKTDQNVKNVVLA